MTSGYFDAAAERAATDPAYRRRLQRERFTTDTTRSIQATLEAHRREEARKTTNPRRSA